MDERADIHNATIDTDAADAGLCGQLHLRTGRACVLPARHPGECVFHDSETVDNAVAVRL